MTQSRARGASEASPEAAEGGGATLPLDSGRNGLCGDLERLQAQDQWVRAVVAGFKARGGYDPGGAMRELMGVLELHEPDTRPPPAGWQTGENQR